MQNFKQLQYNQSQVFSQLSQVHGTSTQSYNLAAENKQRGSKGTFIVSGGGIPRQHDNETLYALIFPLIYRKYGIYVHPQELKELHRLPNNRVLFSLYSRLPGGSFEQLTRAMNSNPNPEIKIYVSIQLFEPYAELYYIARRLKFYKCISNYRLDENGNTQIALHIDKMSFKFTGLDQLKYLNIQVPNQIYQEVAFRRNQICENSAKNVTANNEKAYKVRPNYNQGPGQNHPHQSFIAQSNQHQNPQTTNKSVPLTSSPADSQPLPRAPSVIQFTGQPLQQDHARPPPDQQFSNPGPNQASYDGATVQSNSSGPFVQAPNPNNHGPYTHNYHNYSVKPPSFYSCPPPLSTGGSGGGRGPGAGQLQQAAEQEKNQSLEEQSRELHAEISSMCFDMS